MGMFVEALHRIITNWKLPECPSAVEWVGTVHVSIYWNVIKKNELPRHGGSLNSLTKKAKSAGRSQTQKTPSVICVCAILPQRG